MKTNGVATQTRNEPRCPSDKGADETINKMTKDTAMKRSNDAKKCWSFDRLMNGGKDEMIEKMTILKTKNRKNSIPGNGAKKCCRTNCPGSATTLRPGVVTLIPDVSI